jgi:hypothetical protein
MLWFKSCPRCRGDLSQKLDVYGSYIACYQCGHYLTTAEEIELTAPAKPRNFARAVRKAAERVSIAA